MEVGKTGDMKSWRQHSEWRKEAEATAVADFDPDLSALETHAKQLIEAARESVRRPRD
jgi:hypothetical protein